MIFTTQLELNITIKDINAIYSQDYDSMLLQYAKDLYEGNCRDGQYIKSVDRIVRRSLPNLIKRDLSAKIRVYVVVDATAIRYDQFDLVVGMKVMGIIPAGKIGSSDLIQCENDHAICLVKGIAETISEYKVGDVIPIRVGQATYKFGCKFIKISGYIFAPYVPDPIQFSIGKISAELKAYFGKMITPLVEQERKRRETLDKVQWGKIAKMLYPYKKPTNASGDIDILDLESIQNNVVGIDYSLDMTAMKLSSGKKRSGITTVEEAPKTTLTRLAFQLIKWNAAINDLVEQYPTEEDLKAVEYVWKFYEENKM